MSGAPKPIQINEELEWCAPAYVRSFMAAYWQYGTAHGASAQASVGYLKLYAQSISENMEAIAQDTADGISNYLNRYNVGTDNSVDEYKIIYFLGRSILKYLPDFDVLKGVHLFVMVGLLDFRLQKLGIYKPQLVTAVTSLIRTGLSVFDSELGLTGCYLIFKCVSTTERNEVAEHLPETEKLRGTGLDVERGPLLDRVTNVQ